MPSLRGLLGIGQLDMKLCPSSVEMLEGAMAPLEFLAAPARAGFVAARLAHRASVAESSCAHNGADHQRCACTSGPSATRRTRPKSRRPWTPGHARAEPVIGPLHLTAELRIPVVRPRSAGLRCTAALDRRPRVPPHDPEQSVDWRVRRPKSCRSTFKFTRCRTQSAVLNGETQLPRRGEHAQVRPGAPKCAQVRPGGPSLFLSTRGAAFRSERTPQ